ncbi:MAG: delta-60 repeat domain-containing protein, partial [Candidatus Nanopelagicales bacterium]
MLSVALSVAFSLTVPSIHHVTEAQASVTPTIVDSPIGDVLASAQGPDGTTYAVGTLSGAGAATGGLASLAADDSTLNRSFPAVVGLVKTIVTDPSGGVYIGGTFSRVGGLARTGLARVLPDGTVDSAWAPVLSTGWSVLAMTLVDDTLYVGGSFTTINAEGRQNIAALNATTGALTAWNPGANASVSALTADDSAVYAGGSFTTIASTSRNRLAAFDRSTATLISSWNPGASATINSLVSTGTLVYAAGSFTTIASASRSNLAALNAVATGNANAAAWTPTIGSTVNAIAVDDSLVYAVGTFTTAGSPSQTRNRAAAFARDTATLSASWNPNLGNWALSVALANNAVYVG